MVYFEIEVRTSQRSKGAIVRDIALNRCSLTACNTLDESSILTPPSTALMPYVGSSSPLVCSRPMEEVRWFLEIYRAYISRLQLGMQVRWKSAPIGDIL